MKCSRHTFLLGTALGSILTLATAAFGQEPAVPAAQQNTAPVDQRVPTPRSTSPATVDDSVGDIVVTARQRRESLQSVPISVSSFSEKNIRDAGIERPADFIALTPNVSIAESQQPGLSFITIRGISEVRNGESPVAVVVDGVLQTISNEFNTDLFDLKQIEVLKGPQGALYGRNAIGGAIVITTREPSNDFEGRVLVGAGNGGQTKAQVGVSGPIIEDKLFASISGSLKNRDGYLTDIYLNDKVDPYRNKSGRGRLIFLPTDGVKIDLRASYDETFSGALYFKRNNVNAAGYYVNYPSLRSTASRPGSPDDYGPPLNSNIDGTARRKIFTTSLKIDVDTPIGTLTSTSSYDFVNEFDKGDASPYTSAVAGTQSSDFIWHAESTELRLTSPDKQRLRYIVGAYYLNLHRVAQRNTGVDLGNNRVLLGYNDSFSLNPSKTNTADDNHQNASAGFGQLAYDISDQLELSAALRYDYDKRDTLNISRPKDTNSFATYAPVGTPGTYRQESFDAWQPKATLRYKIDSGSSVYASYSQGFRSGGFNQEGVRALALITNPNTTVTDDYKKERSTTYELGFKSQFFQRKLTFNGAVFYTKFDNSQYFVFLPEAGAQIITNIDRVDMKGYEADILYRPIHGWDIFANLGYTDATIKAYATLPASDGKTAPYVPKFGFNVGTQYAFPVSSSLQLTTRVDVHRKGSQFYETLNTSGVRSAFNLYDARVSLGSLSDKWRITGWVKNALDRKYNSEFVAGGFVYPAEPRTYGLDLEYTF